LTTLPTSTYLPFKGPLLLWLQGKGQSKHLAQIDWHSFILEKKKVSNQKSKINWMNFFLVKLGLVRLNKDEGHFLKESNPSK